MFPAFRANRNNAIPASFGFGTANHITFMIIRKRKGKKLAYDDIWSRVIWHFDEYGEYGSDFSSISLSGIQPELYSVYQAAKGIAVGSCNITIDDLASPELVTDEAFRLIICALLLAKYGDAILNLE